MYKSEYGGDDDDNVVVVAVGDCEDAVDDGATGDSITKVAVYCCLLLHTMLVACGVVTCY